MGAALHIVRKRVDALALDAITEQSRRGPVEVVLVQDGVLAQMPPAVTVYANEDDVAARGLATPHPKVGYDEIARMVVDASSVRVW